MRAEQPLRKLEGLDQDNQHIELQPRREPCRLGRPKFRVYDCRRCALGGARGELAWAEDTIRRRYALRIRPNDAERHTWDADPAEAGLGVIPRRLGHRAAA